MYFSELDSDSWGDDQLEADQTISPNADVNWTMNTNCTIDVRVVYDDGKHDEWRPINTCAYHITTRY